MKTQSFIISVLILSGICESKLSNCTHFEFSIWINIYTYFFFNVKNHLGFAIECYVCLDPECWNKTLSSNKPGDYFGKIENCDSDKSCYTAKVGGKC